MPTQRDAELPTPATLVPAGPADRDALLPMLERFNASCGRASNPESPPETPPPRLGRAQRRDRGGGGHPLRLRLACVLVIAAQLALLALLLAPTGGRAIAFPCVGNPILVVGVLLNLLSTGQRMKEIRRAKVDRCGSIGTAAGNTG